MDTQRILVLGDDEQEILKLEYPILNKVDVETLSRYLRTMKVLQGIESFFNTFQINVTRLQQSYKLFSNGKMKRRFSFPHHRWSDFHNINSLTINLLASGRTLVQALKPTLSVMINDNGEEATKFYDSVIQKKHSEDIIYRIMDCLRDYSQHGDLPVSLLTGGNSAWIDLDQIVRVINFTHKGKRKEDLQELINASHALGMQGRIPLILGLVVYTASVAEFYYQYYCCARTRIMELFISVDRIVAKHPEMVVHEKNLFNDMAIFIDENNTKRGFYPRSEPQKLFDSFQDRAGEYSREQFNEAQKIVAQAMLIRSSEPHILNILSY